MDTTQLPLRHQRKLVELRGLEWWLTRPNQSARKRKRRQERHDRLISELRRQGVPIPSA